jgi:hypothetical protein
MGKREFTFLFAQVVKNGAVHADARIPLRSRRDLAVSQKSGPLRVEHISISADVPLGRVDKGRFILNPEQWTGFASSKGTVVEYHPKSPRMECEMFPGDFASLQHGEFSIVIKLGAPPKRERVKVKLDSQYAPKPFSLLIQSVAEGRAFIGAALFSTVIVASFVLAVLKYNRPVPKELEDLQEQYSLRFIDPEHLRLTPESLQTNYSSADFVPAITKYYRALAAMLLGQDYAHISLQPKNSVEFHKKTIQSWSDELSASLEAQREIESEIESRPSWSLPMVPVVHENSMTLGASRIMGLLGKHHKALEENLALRRLTSVQYKNEDTSYSDSDYRGAQSGKKAQEALSKIHVLEVAGPEELMYRRAEDLSLQASYQQLKTGDARVAKGDKRPGAGLIKMPKNFEFASITNMINWRGDRRFSQLMGAELGKEKPTFRITGTLPSNLIEAEINKKKYELQLCYELALRRNHNASGSVEWSWVIDKRGKPQEINLLADSIKDREMTACIRRKLSQWSFPRPENGSVKVRFPFQFTPAKG